MITVENDNGQYQLRTITIGHCQLIVDVNFQDIIYCTISTTDISSCNHHVIDNLFNLG